MKSPKVLFAAIGLLALNVACNPTKKTTVEPSTPAAKFSLTDQEVADLRGVGCDVQGSSVVCAKIDAAKTSSAEIEKRRAALAEIQKHTRTSFDLNAIVLGATAAALEVETKAIAAGKIADGVTEQLYQTILSYACDVGSENKSLAYGANSDVSYGSPDQETMSGLLSFTASTKQLTLKGHAGLAGKGAHLMVETDGEFALMVPDETTFSASCYHHRANGPATTFTDRPVEGRRLECSTTIVNPGVTVTNQTGWSYVFTSSTRDKDNALDLFSQRIGKDDFTKDMPIFTSKYISRGFSSGGFLKLEIYSRETGKVALSAVTPNSTPTSTFGYRDPSGDGLIIRCTSK